VTKPNTATKEEITKILSDDLFNMNNHLKYFKPDDRTELDRRFAVAITDFEKLVAYINMYILNPLNKK